MGGNFGGKEWQINACLANYVRRTYVHQHKFSDYLVQRACIMDVQNTQEQRKIGMHPFLSRYILINDRCNAFFQQL